MSATTDKITLGVTAEGEAALEAIMETGWFAEQMDAYRVAVSLAFANDLVLDSSEMSGVETKWNVGTLDPNGELRALVVALSDDVIDRPYAHAEERAAAGLLYLKSRLVDRSDELADVLIGTNAP